MKTNSFFRSAALLASLALAVPVFAKPVSKTIRIPQNARFGKSELKAGEYRLLVDGSKVLVQKGNNTLAETEGRWEERAAKSDYNSVLVGANGEVMEVRFAGEKRVLVLSE
jgi:hypothetical protein